MGFNSISPRVTKLIVKLMREYNVDANIRLIPYKQVHLFRDSFSHEEMVANAVHALNKLGPGTYEFYEHPGMLIDSEEKAIVLFFLLKLI